MGIASEVNARATIVPQGFTAERLVSGEADLAVQQISELKIGDNINATPAILGGRIYIGAFNGKLYCLK